MKPEISLIPAREPAVPEDRKGFTPKQRADAFLRAGGKCEVCGVKIFGGAFQVDHIIARNHLGKHEPSNWRVLCIPCHKDKTAEDAGISAKINRIQEKHGFKEPKRKPGPKLRGAGFSNRNRKLNGTVGLTQAAARAAREK